MDEEKQVSKREDGILIEKEGRFELVSVSDMQAHEDQQEMCVDGVSGIQNEPTTTNIQEDTSHQSTNDQSIEMSDHQRGDSQSKTSSSENGLQSEAVQSIATDQNIKSESVVSFAVVSEENKPPSQNVSKLSAASASTLTQNPKHKLLVMRTKSAPGHRDSTQSCEEEALKRERNEAAFRAWLTKKNREYVQQRQSEESKIKKTEEELLEKQRRNEVAYQAWLECKKQEFQQKAKEKAIRPVTSITRDEEDKRRAAFENWLSKKQEERLKESGNRQRVREQEETTAKKADPTIVTQAYKSWLHRKRTQARDEALRKEQYRKKYFRQSRQLKQSASLRFEGF